MGGRLAIGISDFQTSVQIFLNKKLSIKCSFSPCSYFDTKIRKIFEFFAKQNFLFLLTSEIFGQGHLDKHPAPHVYQWCSLKHCYLALSKDLELSKFQVVNNDCFLFNRVLVDWIRNKKNVLYDLFCCTFPFCRLTLLGLLISMIMQGNYYCCNKLVIRKKHKNNIRYTNRLKIDNCTNDSIAVFSWVINWTLI